MKRIVIIILGLMVMSTSVEAQSNRQYTTNINGWLGYNGTHAISKKISIHLEAQVRRNEIISYDQQLLFRTGVNYHLNHGVSLTAGYCFAQTYPYGEFPSKASFPENRAWEQLQIKSSIGIIETINRLRLEQRFINAPVLNNGVYTPGEAVYTNRIRVLNRFSIPFKGKTIEDKTFYISVFDEVYINFGKNVLYNILDQNRSYLGIGYKIPKAGRLELGYLNQLLFKADGIKVENNHTIQVSFSCAIAFIKAKD